MAAFLKLKSSFQRLKPRFFLQRCCHTFIEGVSEAELLAELGPKTMAASGDVDTSNWKTVDSRSLGITLSMIPYASRTVVRILQSEGYDAYLVGGCVRDLVLNQIPKDFDVITTANLQQIKKKFHRAFIVGRRFPICMVHVRGSEIEVSSFETVASHGEGKEEVHLTEMPEGYDKKDLMRWRNSLNRDFTVNSMFYDPFAHKIYDYSNGMSDLMAMKLRTLVPAHSSFQVDCARILRGLRIAARLGFSFAKETEKAIYNLYASVKTLDKGRLMLEMNYMLSYGAAQPSILLLKEFNLLDILLPFQAAYLADHSAGRTPTMLMKLLSNLDSLVSCDQPCDSVLWVSLLIFHLALVNNPQGALVVWTFSSLLYHGTWREGVKAARELSGGQVNFAPEISISPNDLTDEELAQRVSKFASIVRDTKAALNDSKSLRKIMGRYPSSSRSNMVFISKNAGKAAAEIFYVLMDDIRSLQDKRRCYSIDYELLGKGDVGETRFALGKVIMDTMRGGITQKQTKLLSEKKDNFYASKLKGEKADLGKQNSKNLKQETQNPKDREKRRSDRPNDQLDQQKSKKQKQKKTSDVKQQVLCKEKLAEILSCQTIAKQMQHRKEVVKDVSKFFSLQKEMPQQDAKLDIGQQFEARNLKEISKPTVEKQHQNLTRNGIFHVLESVSKVGKQCDGQDSDATLCVLENASNIFEPHKVQAPMEMVNVRKLSNLLEGDKDCSKIHSKPEKQTIIGESWRDKTKKIKRTPKLSSIFK